MACAIIKTSTKIALKLLHYVLDGGGDTFVPTWDAYRISLSLYEFGDKQSNESYTLLKAVIEFLSLFSIIFRFRWNSA
jgi:hypothetical protein